MNRGLRASRRARAAGLALLVVVPALVSGTTAPATACPAVDPKCVLDETTEEAKKVVEGVEETVREGASDPVGTAEGILESGKQKVSETLEGSGGTPPAPPAEEPPEGTGSGPGKASAPGPTGTEKRSASGSRTGGAGAFSGRARVGVPRTHEDNPVGAGVEPGSSGAQGKRSEGDLAEAARRLAFPLLLSALVALFLFLQGRVDRRHPKLVLAPVDTELLLFE